MIAYVFWHAPHAGVDRAMYASALQLFHAALAAQPPPGFLRSFSTQVSRLPWLDADVAYEDWYLITDSSALDPLDAAAVDARRRGPHDAVAGAARTGAGALYRLRRGEPIAPVATSWFAKPDGTTYTTFEPALAKLSGSGSTIWQRMMVLGPAPEYAAQTATREYRDDAVAAVQIVHQRLDAVEGSAEI